VLAGHIVSWCMCVCKQAKLPACMLAVTIEVRNKRATRSASIRRTYVQKPTIVIAISLITRNAFDYELAMSGVFLEQASNRTKLQHRW
jgi:hypothetical protein